MKTDEKHYTNAVHSELLIDIQQLLEDNGITVEITKRPVTGRSAIVVYTTHGQFQLNLIIERSSTFRSKPSGYKINFHSPHGELPLKNWTKLDYSREDNKWSIPEIKVLQKVKENITRIDGYLNKKNSDEAIGENNLARLKREFPDSHISYASYRGRRKSPYQFLIDNKRFSFTVWATKDYGDGKTDEITTSAITARRSSTDECKDTATNFLNKLEAIENILKGVPVTTIKSKRTKSSRTIKDSAISYLRNSDLTHLTYKEIAELIRGEHGSKTTAKSIAYYYSKFKNSDKLLARTKKAK